MQKTKYATRGRHGDLDSLPSLVELRVGRKIFQATPNPFEPRSCILWLRDEALETRFGALGKFRSFDKGRIAAFVARYATNPSLRQEIDTRRFERHVRSLNRTELSRLAKSSGAERLSAYRALFDLDESAFIEKATLSRRRRSMTRLFHPDAGGFDDAMSLVNEAYDYLARHAAKGA